jgi:threonine dehydrogenase-like Zn-dependent dehydrogenase
MMIDPRSITHKMDGSAPVERAVAIAVLANGARWCLLGRVTIGEWVVIQGPGAQGIGSAAVAKTMGANVIVTGIAKDRERLEFVKRMGADHAICIDEEDAVERVKEITGGRMADVVLENSGAPAAVPQGLELCGRKARYVLSGYSKKASVEIVKDLIALKELEVIGGWGQAGGFRAGNQVINEGRFKLEEMVTNHFTVENAHQGVEKVISGEIALKAVVQPIQG